MSKSLSEKYFVKIQDIPLFKQNFLFFKKINHANDSVHEQSYNQKKNGSLKKELVVGSGSIF